MSWGSDLRRECCVVGTSISVGHWEPEVQPFKEGILSSSLVMVEVGSGVWKTDNDYGLLKQMILQMKCVAKQDSKLRRSKRRTRVFSRA